MPASNASKAYTSQSPLSLGQLSQARKLKDRLATITITGGGFAVLGAILLIFFYLLYEIMPLFNSATLEEEASYSVSSLQGSSLLYLAMEEQAEIAFAIDDSGQALFFTTATGDPLKQQALLRPGEVSSFALNSNQQPLFALGTFSGEVVLAKHHYRVSYPGDLRLITPVIEYPYGSERMKLSEGAILRMAVRDSEEALMLVALSEEGLVARRWSKEEDFLSEEVTLEEELMSLPPIDITIDHILIGPDQRWIYLVSNNGEFRIIDVEASIVVSSGSLINSGLLTEVKFLLGGISLMVASDQGSILQWFLVASEGERPRLQQIRDFSNGDQAITALAVEHRRKGFLAVDQTDTLSIYYTTSQRRLLSESLAKNRVQQLAVSPRSNAFISFDDTGLFHFWRMDNQHPEVSWQALWSKVWYESYPEPDYIWQSSASNNDFEPKYSFAPLAFGTLKAAFYAMLIATPLAICGAIYTAYFMAPAMRRKVKPLIELMEALPTVILGFLAGLWLAPFIEGHLPGVFSIFIVMPIGVLLFGFLWNRLPLSWSQRVPDGWHAALLIPVVMLLSVLCIELSAPFEIWFFGGDMRTWLTNDLGISFDQRNSLVVGIAMGFAVIPTIFSITEDAIFSVPKHLSYGSLALGATPWQTLVGVVMPTASPGIFSALMIGMGRAVGETMIVLMATGNTPIMDANIFEGMRTLAANIAVEIGETEVDSSHYRVLFLAAFVLFLFTFVVNTGAEIVRQRLRKKYGSL
jgi:phosphate transport system permease protein